MNPLPVGLLGVVLLIGAGRAAMAQGEQPPAQAAPVAPRAVAGSLSVQDLPFSLDRIRRKLAAAPPTKTDGLRLHYYIEVYGKATAIDFFRDFDLTTGPVPYGAPTHTEFLQLVTPQEFRAPPADLTAIIKWLSTLGKTKSGSR